MNTIKSAVKAMQDAVSSFNVTDGDVAVVAHWDDLSDCYRVELRRYFGVGVRKVADTLVDPWELVEGPGQLAERLARLAMVPVKEVQHA